MSTPRFQGIPVEPEHDRRPSPSPRFSGIPEAEQATPRFQGTPVEDPPDPSAPSDQPAPLTQQEKREALAREQRLLTQQLLEQDRELAPLLNDQKSTEGGNWRQLRHGITQGLGDFSTLINKGAAHIARAVGAEGLADQYDERATLSAGATQDVEQMASGEAGSSLVRQVTRAGVGVAPMISPMGLPYAMGVGGLQSYLHSKQSNEQLLLSRGATPEQAREQSRIPSIGAGLVTMLVTRAGGNTGPEALRQVTTNPGFKAGAMEFLRQVGFEGAEEYYDQFFQGMIQKATLEPDKTWEQIHQESGEAGVIGAIVGVPFGAVHAVGNAGSPAPQSPSPTPIPAPIPFEEAPPYLEDLPPMEDLLPITGEPMPLEEAPADLDAPPAVDPAPVTESHTFTTQDGFTFDSRALLPAPLVEDPSDPSDPSASSASSDQPDPAAQSTQSLLPPQEFPVISTSTSEVVARPDLMQFKRVDEADSGINEEDRLESSDGYDPLKGGVLLVWEPVDPEVHGLQGNEKYIVANGHHRHEFARRTGRDNLNIQVLKESEGYSAEDARAMGAEINIADGKGTIQDQAKYIRNQAATHGQDEAVARARSIGARGRKAATIGIQATDPLFDAFVNETITPEQAEAIAEYAPGKESHQRAGIQQARRGSTPNQIANFLQALNISSQVQRMDTPLLFGEDDSAMREAERRGKAAAVIQEQLTRQIRAADQAARNPEMARRQGLDFAKDPEAIRKETQRLKEVRRRWAKWGQDSELVNQVDQVAAQLEDDIAPEEVDLRFSIDNTWWAAPTYEQGDIPRGKVSEESESDRKTIRALEELFHVTVQHGGVAGFGGTKDGPVGEAFQAILEAFGKRVVFLQVGDVKGEKPVAHRLHGLINTGDPNTIYLNRKSRHGVARVVGHEMVESLAVTDPMLYEALETVVMSRVRESGFNEYAEGWKAGRESLGYDPENFTEADIRRDLVADYVGNRVAESSFWNLLYNESPSLFQRVKDALLRMFEQLRFLAAGKKYAVDGIIRDRNAVDAAIATVLKQHALVGWAKRGMLLPEQLRLSADPSNPAPPPDPKERRHPQQMDASADLSDTFKRQVAPREYLPRRNEEDAEWAARTIQTHGLPGAESLYRDEGNGIPGAQRTALGHAILKAYGQAERRAISAGDQQAATQAIEAQVKLADHIIHRSTELAQSLQAFAMFHSMTPAGILGTARRQIQQVGRTKREQIEEQTDAITDALEEINQETTTRLPGDKGTQQAVEDAITDVIPDSPAVQEAIHQEVIEDVIRKNPDRANEIQDHFNGATQGTLQQILEESGLGPNQAKVKADKIHKDHKEATGQARRKADGELTQEKKRRKQRAKTTGDWMRKIGSAWHREAEGASQRLGKHALKGMEGQAPASPTSNKTALQEFTQRLARELKATIDQVLDRQPAAKRQSLTHTQVLREYLTNPDKYQMVWDGVRRQVEAAIQENPELEHELRPFLDHIGNLAPDNRLQGAIRETIRALNIDLTRIVKSHWTVQEGTRRALADKLMGDLKLPEAVARTLAEKIQKRFEALAKERKDKILQHTFTTRAGQRIPKTLVEKLVELTNLGALGSAEYHQAVADKLKLPHLDQATQKKLVNLANELQSTPEGFQSDRIGIEIMNTIARAEGINPLDLGMAFWYANSLSGFTTQILNVFANTLNLGAHVALRTLRDPSQLGTVLTNLGIGLQRGYQEAAEVLKTGQITGTRNLKLEASRPLELKKFTGVAYPLNAWKYVMRVMSAADMMFYKPAEAMQQQVAAEQIAKREGINGEALRKRVRQLLNDSENARAKAQATATREGLTGRDWIRRVDELIDQGRPDELRTTAREYALRVTFNNKPYGVLGAIASSVNHVAGHLPVLRLVVPFTNIVSNVTNESLNYFPPIGIVRAYWGRAKGKVYGQPVKDASEIHELYAKAAIGMAGMVGMAILGHMNLEDEDPRIMITANGPKDGRRRNQLRETGWIPYSIKFGNRYYSYADTPLAVPMAIVGQWIDAHRYENIENLEERLAVAFMAAPKVIVERSYLEGINSLMKALSADPNARTTQRTISTIMRTGASFAVPNLLRQIDRVFDPTIYKEGDLQGVLVEQLPFVRRLNKPALNALGEPISSGPLKRFTEPGDRKDPLWNVIVDKQAWISLPTQGDLTENQYYDLLQHRGKALRRRLDREVHRLQGMPAEEAQEHVRNIAREETRRSKESLGYYRRR